MSDPPTMPLATRFGISSKPISRELTPAGTSAHRRQPVKLDQFLVADHPRTDYDQITVRSMLAIVVRPVSAIKRGESRDCAPRNEYPSASDCHSSLLRLRL